MKPELVIHLPLEGAPWLALQVADDKQLDRVLDWIAQPRTRERIAAIVALATGDTLDPP